MTKLKDNRIYLYIFIFFIISVINLYNAKYLNNLYKYYYIKQTIWYIAGFITMLFFSKRNINHIFKYAKLFYYVLNILLLYLLLFGDSINSIRAWISIGPINFQPSEFMKLALALVLINVLCSKDKKIIKFIKLSIYTLIPSILVFLEPDTGAIIFYILIFVIMLFFLKLKWYYYFLFLLLALLLIGGFTYLFMFNQDILIKLIGTSFFYRVDRFINFRTNNYQLDLALISIFSAPLFRNGFNNMALYIPEGATDFIFAFSIGNFGFILAIMIIILYALFILYINNILRKNHHKKTNYLIVSFNIMFGVQVLINILMNIGLVPIIGITLPFLSYGGSSMLFYFIYLGLILSLTTTLDSNKSMNSFHMDKLD